MNLEDLIKTAAGTAMGSLTAKAKEGALGILGGGSAPASPASDEGATYELGYTGPTVAPRAATKPRQSPQRLEKPKPRSLLARVAKNKTVSRVARVSAQAASLTPVGAAAKTSLTLASRVLSK